jgi:hypothetical protein
MEKALAMVKGKEMLWGLGLGLEKLSKRVRQLELEKVTYLVMELEWVME